MMFLTLNRKFIFSICLLMVVGFQSLKAQTFATGRITFTYNDPSRTGGFGSGGGAGRQIQSELYYPAATAGTNVAVANGRFPVVVFAHGFQMTWDSYEILYDSLVRNGYIVVAPRTEGGLSPNHTDFGKDLAIVLDRTLRFDTILSSPFFGKIVQKGAIAGHSMGGGSTFLADQYNSRATCYFTMAPANTNPRSSLAAKTITKPMCILAGTRDCVAPIADHQQVMYDSLMVSACKQIVKITDARHCSFSDGTSTQCNFGEGFSGCASSPLTTAQQIVISRNCMIPYFNYFLKGVCSEWAVFQNYITNTSALNTTQSCTMSVPSNASISGANSFCAGNSTTLSAAPAGFTYAWSNTATAVSTTISSAGSYTVSVSNPYCTISSSPFAVTQNSVPTSPTIISGSDTVCANVSNISYSISSVPTATGYAWNFPSGWIITNDSTTSPSFSVGSSSGAISVSAINACGSSAPVSKNIIVQSGPDNPTAILGLDSFCAGSGAKTYSTATITGATSYQWTFPNGWVGNSSTNTITFANPSSSGTLSVAAVGNCGAGPSISMSVNVVDTPNAVLFISGSTAQTSTVGSNYEWYLNGVLFATTTSPSVAIISTGNYSVKVTNSAGCSGLSNSVFYQNVGINDVSKTSFYVFPNPASGYFVIKNALKNAAWKVYDLLGKTSLEGTIHAKEERVETFAIPIGSYILEIGSERVLLILK